MPARVGSLVPAASRAPESVGARGREPDDPESGTARGSNQPAAKPERKCFEWYADMADDFDSERLECALQIVWSKKAPGEIGRLS